MGQKLNQFSKKPQKTPAKTKTLLPLKTSEYLKIWKFLYQHLML